MPVMLHMFQPVSSMVVVLRFVSVTVSAALSMAVMWIGEFGAAFGFGSAWQLL